MNNVSSLFLFRMKSYLSTHPSTSLLSWETYGKDQVGCATHCLHYKKLKHMVLFIQIYY
jgi:hypothetical protein